MTGSLRLILTRATAVGLVLAVVSAGAAMAQNPRHASGYGSDWGYFQYDTGAGASVILGGGSMLSDGQPDTVITLVSRDGHALRESDRAEAVAVARALCEQGGRQFNTQTRGQWLDGGRLSFDGACTEW